MAIRQGRGASSPSATTNASLSNSLEKLLFRIKSEWWVKVVGNHSYVRLGIVNRKGRFAGASTLVILGPEVRGRSPKLRLCLLTD